MSVREEEGEAGELAKKKRIRKYQKEERER